MNWTPQHEAAVVRWVHEVALSTHPTILRAVRNKFRGLRATPEMIDRDRTTKLNTLTQGKNHDLP